VVYDEGEDDEQQLPVANLAVSKGCAGGHGESLGETKKNPATNVRGFGF